MKIDWKYPLYFGIDTESQFKSLWLGWWLITWSGDADFPFEFHGVSFQPD